jgi:CRP-like cAMP-binding protein
MVTSELLKSLEPFKELNAVQLGKLQKYCEEIEFEFNEKLFTQGDPAMHLWVVVDGAVDLRFEMPDRRPSSPDQTVDSVEVMEREPEAKVLGWSCFVPPYKMRLSAVCISKSCSIVRVDKGELFNLFQEDPLMGYLFMSYMIKVVGYRFHQFQNHVAKNLGEDLMFGW